MFRTYPGLGVFRDDENGNGKFQWCTIKNLNVKPAYLSFNLEILFMDVFRFVFNGTTSVESILKTCFSYFSQNTILVFNIPWQSLQPYRLFQQKLENCITKLPNTFWIFYDYDAKYRCKAVEFNKVNKRFEPVTNTELALLNMFFLIFVYHSI